MGAPYLAAVMAAAAAGGVITPSGPEVPANLLRIEVHLDHALPAQQRPTILLRDAAGREIADALLDLVLPDQDGRQLVLLLQPGRIKHGVGPNIALGPALRDGEQVSIEVGTEDLARPLRRSWRVGPPQQQALTPATWTVRAPAAGGRTPLVLALNSPVNASAAQLIAVADAKGRRIAGHAVLAAGESEWHFVPASGWKTGSYQLRIHPELEDPAGNRLCAAFEARRQSALRCDQEARIRFRIQTTSGTRPASE